MEADVIVRPPTHPKLDAQEVAVKYAKDVLTGKIVAGKLVKLACKRFIDDWKNGKARGLIWRRDKAQHVIDFFGFLKHTKGEWGGQTFVLLPWQVFVLANMFGWYYADGTRRFKEIYIEVARKNGKSTLMAGIGLYMLFADGEPGAEVYSAATKKDQARIVFEEAANMRKASPLLSSRIAVMGSKKPNNLNVLITASKFEPLSSEDQTLDGLNVHCALIDELHAHPDRGLYDVIYEATGSRRSPMIIAITTAGYNRLGVCYKQRTLCERILVGGVPVDRASDSIFAFIACADTDDNWEDEKNWYKANPGLQAGVIKIDKLRAAALKAKEDPTALNSFLRKHLNVWTSQDIRWMPPDKWAACNSAGPLADVKKLRLDALKKLKGRMCFGGMDMSSKIDITAFALIFPPIRQLIGKRYKMVPDGRGGMREDRLAPMEPYVKQEADPLWRVLMFYWMPEANVEERVKKDRVQYDVWIKQGFMWTTPGNTVDQDFIRASINKLHADYRIEEIGYDSWNATQIKVNLEQDGFKMEEARQGFKSMSEPMKEVMALVLSKKLEHYGDPVLSWMMGNVSATQDPAGNIKPDKEVSAEKIDGPVALITGMSRIVANPNASPDSVYSQRGIVFI
jgi:phage terminase large subunit-like protein